MRATAWLVAATATAALAAPAHAAASAGLVVTSVSVRPVQAGRLRIGDVTRNAGTRRSARTRLRYRVIAGGRSRVVAIRRLPALAPGRSSHGSALTGLPGGRYRVAVCADRCRTVAPPAIGARPDDPTNATSARFTFSSRGARLRCRLDDAPLSRCTSPLAYRGLGAGEHVFTVLATRARGDAAAVYRWTVDLTAPPPPIVTGRPSALSALREGEFRFTDADADAALRCALDDAPPAPCASPQRYPGPLADGAHAFTVAARDRAGNTGAPTTVGWTVDATPPPAPLIAERPDPVTADTAARLAFSDREAGVRFSCRLDDAAPEACSSPVDYRDLSTGAHHFTVTARDAAGNAAGTDGDWTVVVAPDAQTGAALTVQPTSAAVGGTVTPHAGYFVEYGPTTAYGSRSAAGTAGPGGDVQVGLTGLSSATEYHYRLVATTCGGCGPGTARGADRTFTTPPVGTYQNPVFGGLPDPMGLRGQGDYYVYGTGDRFPVLHSTDLVHWTQLGTAMTRRPAWVPQSGEWNPWAPSVLQRDGACPGTTSSSCFFMYYTGLDTAISPAANCIAVATATDPAGPFTDAGILTSEGDGAARPLGCGDDAGYSNIDPAPFIDPATGNAYLYLSTGHDASGAWARTISVVPLADDLVHAAGGRRALFGITRPWERDVVEGPWMVHHGDGYYLLYSGGSFTDATYAMGYALGASPTGPFTKPAPAPILASTADVIGPGGGSALTGPDGGDWLVYHGRAAAGAPRTLRIDPLVWDEGARPATVTVRGPTASPQPLPAPGT